MSEYTFIDLFCGIGGFRMAFESQGARCVFSSDIDEYAAKTYEANFGEKPQGDITKIKSGDIPGFDILCAGFPCQPFSYAGLRQGFGDPARGTLFFEIKRILTEKRPKMFLLENVKGLVSHRKGETLKVITDTLTSLDYDIHWKVLCSLDYGLPQKRERWYCAGFDKKTDFEFPRPLGTKPKLWQIIDLGDNDPKLRLSDFEIARIKYHFANCKERGQRVRHENTNGETDSVRSRMGVYSYQKPDGTLRFHQGDKRKSLIQEAYYVCLDTYAPSIIAARAPKLWDIGRRVSVKEAAMLQGFPEDFKFPVSDHQAYKQLGNSVSVPVVALIADRMIKSY